jgi:chemotaxis regulatin CheY-phosphate phosphatase CheZ
VNAKKVDSTEQHKEIQNQVSKTAKATKERHNRFKSERIKRKPLRNFE